MGFPEVFLFLLGWHCFSHELVNTVHDTNPGCGLIIKLRWNLNNKGRIFHYRESTLLHEFPLHSDATCILSRNVASHFLLVSQEYRSIVLSRQASHPHWNIVRIISGLRTIVRIFARILAPSFSVAVHWLEFLQ